MNLTDIRKLAQLLRETPEVGSIEVRGWFGRGIVLTRHGNASTQVAPAPAPAPDRPHTPPGPVADSRPIEKAAPPVHLKEIKSPMVGTFYAAPEPGASPYLKVGARVSVGQTVCIIEAMKIMNEIEAEVAGVVREICVDDATPVEFGQALFRVDPHG